MAVTYGFYNALNHDRLYDAIQMSSIFDGIIRDGIFSTIGDTMIVTAPEDGMYVNVGSGRAWFNHTWTLNDTAYPIEAEQAEVVLDRIDAVILEVNSSAEVRANSIKFLKGTPSSNPVKPTLTHNAEVNQYALAYVRIRAGQTTIFQSDIENAVGTDETPFITGVLQQVSIETLLKQWEAEFNTYFTNFQNTSTTEFNNWLATKVSEYTAWFAQMQTDMDSNFNEFDAWFQRMKDQLSSDAAGHLQAQIDALSEAAKKGSVVTVTTTDPTLFGKNVTISKTGFDPVTSSFNSAGVAYFETVPMVGDVSIEATNGTLTAHGSLNIPYFGRYSTTLELWEAILDISTTIESLYNRQITVTKNSSTVGTTTFDSTGHATFSVHSVGTYKVSATDSLSTTYEVDVEVTEETTYTVELGSEIDGATVKATDNITIWLKCANIEDPSVTTLADVLANRSLFETLIANSNACNYMARSTTWAGGLVPKMTSNTTPSGEAISSGVYDNHYDNYKAFNGTLIGEYDAWVSKKGQTNNCWIGYDFGFDVVVRKFTITNRNFITNPIPHIKSAILQGFDGNNWNDIQTYTGGFPTTSNGSASFIVDSSNAGSYSKYRLYITSSEGFDYVQVGLLQFYSDIIDITSSQDAMSLIGKYDYCSNALLSNTTWAEAIGNSEYFEEVLVSLIPTMTSDTAPSGVVSAYSNYNTTSLPYKAVDGVATASEFDAWIGNQNSVGEKWWQYEFDSPKIINRMYISGRKYTNDKNGQINSFVLKGSNDGTNWTDLTGTIDRSSVGRGDRTYHNINNTVAYKYYRVGDIPDSIPGIGELQFYGRASVQTNIIHSAANDTIYMKKNGSPVVLTTTDSNGVGTLDFTQFDDGVTYTLYSSVAKDPNNLSNDYSKNIRITKSKYGCTTEAYLMPDAVKTLYWYGYKGYKYNVNNITFNTNTFKLDYRSASAQSWLMPVSKFNISNYSKGHIITDIYDGSWIYVGLYGSPKYYPDKIVVNQCRGNKHSEGDLSSYSGEYYFGVSGSNGLSQYVSTEYLDVAALWLE